MNIGELVQAFGSFEIVDLSHRYREGMPKWPDHGSFAREQTGHYAPAYHNTLTIHEHNGTHIDAPAHYIPEGDFHLFIDQLPLSSFFGRAVRIDLRHAEKNHAVTRAEIAAWESAHFPIVSGDAVLFDFGLADAWETGDTGRILRDWPGLSGDAAAYLRDKKVKIAGTDALAIDILPAEDNPAHFALLGAGVLVVENLANLHLMPDEGFFICLPLKIEGGSGSPLRAIGLKPRG